ncbi:hypothetical protein [Phyllobacterium zundukense]|uniref:Uncharacterized protein n=1 Tax=Phyllobacterium zundukense TaxID=1867719 RepID=A0A2N9W170_9HYPH|nr:hypothetical protein [Phyllobacterium zundukense]ATU94586.1 hypothetical protein BLM14_22645 [Phyllobacterium zundukense]PIO45488.1 hypothetical protein B5P45_07300 [Phyllobacterium zundukense]
MFKLVGAILVIAGVLYSVWVALSHRKLSRPPQSSDSENAASLEPRRQGLRFLGLTKNLPAAIVIVIGAALLLYVE